MSISMIRSDCPYDSNIYLLKGSSALLIDTGTGLDSDHILAEIDDRLGDVPLDAVLLTHCHADHIGGLLPIMEKFGCPAYISAIDLPAACKPDIHTTFADMLHIHLPSVTCSSFAPDDMFDIGDHRLSIIPTPGHTSGSVCFYDAVTRSLFSGDTVFSHGYGRTDLPTGSDLQLRSSLHRLFNVNIGTLYPGHGPLSADGREAIADAMRMMGESY